MSVNNPFDTDFFPLTKENLADFVACSVSAYKNYPLTNWMLRHSQDIQSLRILWQANLAALLGKAYVVAESSRVQGLAIWTKADFPGIDAGSFLSNGGLQLWPSIPRMLRYEAYANQLKKRYAPNDSWYLYDLAVCESAQGKGVASALIRPALSYFDRHGLACYLETHDENNVSLYEHFGFRIVEIGRVPGSSLDHFAMLRDIAANRVILKN